MHCLGGNMMIMMINEARLNVAQGYLMHNLSLSPVNDAGLTAQTRDRAELSDIPSNLNELAGMSYGERTAILKEIKEAAAEKAILQAKEKADSAAHAALEEQLKVQAEEKAALAAKNKALEVEKNAMQEKEMAEFRTSMDQMLGSLIGPAAAGWQTVRVDKASFPYVVARETKRVAGIANEKTKWHMDSISRILGAQDQSYRVFSDTIKASKQLETIPGPDSSLFKSFDTLLKEEVSRGSNYYTEGTLVIVGWGSGDHEAGRGYIPVSGSKTASRMSYGITTNPEFRDLFHQARLEEISQAAEAMKHPGGEKDLLDDQNYIIIDDVKLQKRAGHLAGHM
jgi:hypothetical protein